MNHIFHSNNYNIILQAHAFALATPCISQLHLEGIYFKRIYMKNGKQLKKKFLAPFEMTYINKLQLSPLLK